ncbi:hypothetical protein ACMHYJ_14125 [Castellaniella hirudinis]|uniref:hypothetical protein n=1 Tax=Castellaniella hirudinis TaxID=1144617 RepID=UPI0039C2EAF7
MDIKNLIPKKVAVETSAGELYVRHNLTGDLEKLKKLESGEGGLTAALVRLYASEDQNNFDVAPLSDSLFSRLGKDDIENILAATARQVYMKDLPEGLVPDGLSDFIKNEIVEEEKKRAKMFEKAGLYSFLGDQAYSSILEQEKKKARMQGLAGLSAIAETEARASRVVFEQPKPIRLPENPLIKLSQENAQISRNMAQKTDSLIDVVSGLHDALVVEVLPKWMEEARKSEQRTGEALEISKAQVVESIKSNAIAARGQRLTKIAVGVAIVAALSGLVGQIWGDKTALDATLKTLHDIEISFQEKLTDQQALIAQQRSEIERLQGVVAEKPDAISK